MLSIIISILALVATFYQLNLQRMHNEKSLKPLGQIYFWDSEKNLSVQVINNGLGPLIIDQLMFKKGDTIYASIKDCVDLTPKSYMHISSDDPVKRVILPNGKLTVFETTFDDDENEATIDHTKLELSSITLKVDYRDIYDNKTVVERDFNWFSRHLLATDVLH